MKSGERDAAHRAVLKRALWASVGAFLFSFALIPIYQIYCEITGINGKTGRMTRSEAQAHTIDRSRTVEVQFDAAVNSKLPWVFTPKQKTLDVHPGELIEAWYVATNVGASTSVGNAVPSVSPNRASIYFNKTECFCFTEQPLAPGESKDMPVRFVIDPDLPRDVGVVTLSYTFFLNDVATARVAKSETRTDNPGS